MEKPNHTVKSKRWYLRWYMIALYVFIGLIVLIEISSNGQPYLTIPKSTESEFIELSGKFAWPNAEVTLYKSDNSELGKQTADDKGNFTFANIKLAEGKNTFYAIGRQEGKEKKSVPRTVVLSSPIPTLNIIEPTSYETESESFTLKVQTDPSAILKINGETVTTENGIYQHDYPLQLGTNDFVFVVDSGKKQNERNITITRNIPPVEQTENIPLPNPTVLPTDPTPTATTENAVQTEPEAAQSEQTNATPDSEGDRAQDTPVTKTNPIQRIYEITQRIGGNYEVTVWDMGENLVHAWSPDEKLEFESTFPDPPYEIFVIADTGDIADCFSAKWVMFDYFKNLYTDDLVKDKIARIKFTSLRQIDTSMGSVDALKLDWSSLGPTTVLDTLIKFPPSLYDSGPLDQRSWGKYLVDCEK